MTVKSRRISISPLGVRDRFAGLTSASLSARSWLPGENFVEQGFGLVLVGAFGEGELAHENLARLGEHALLAGGQTALAVAAPQVADDLGHLVDVTGGDLLDV